MDVVGVEAAAGAPNEKVGAADGVEDGAEAAGAPKEKLLCRMRRSRTSVRFALSLLSLLLLGCRLLLLPSGRAVTHGLAAPGVGVLFCCPNPPPVPNEKAMAVCDGDDCVRVDRSREEGARWRRCPVPGLLAGSTRPYHNHIPQSLQRDSHHCISYHIRGVLLCAVTISQTACINHAADESRIHVHVRC